MIENNHFNLYGSPVTVAVKTRFIAALIVYDGVVFFQSQRREGQVSHLYIFPRTGAVSFGSSRSKAVSETFDLSFSETYAVVTPVEISVTQFCHIHNVIDSIAGGKLHSVRHVVGLSAGGKRKAQRVSASNAAALRVK